MAQNLWGDLIKLGLDANKPPTPDLPQGITCFYYTTDTHILYFWTGAAWVAIGSLVGGNLVQAVAFASLPGTPVQGQLVVVTDAASAYAKGVTVAAGDSSHVILAFFDGTNWVGA